MEAHRKNSLAKIHKQLGKIAREDHQRFTRCRRDFPTGQRKVSDGYPHTSCPKIAPRKPSNLSVKGQSVIPKPNDQPIRRQQYYAGLLGEEGKCERHKMEPKPPCPLIPHSCIQTDQGQQGKDGE